MVVDLVQAVGPQGRGKSKTFLGLESLTGDRLADVSAVKFRPCGHSSQKEKSRTRPSGELWGTLVLRPAS